MYSVCARAVLSVVDWSLALVYYIGVEVIAHAAQTDRWKRNGVAGRGEVSQANKYVADVASRVDVLIRR